MRVREIRCIAAHLRVERGDVRLPVLATVDAVLRADLPDRRVALQEVTLAQELRHRADAALPALERRVRAGAFPEPVPGVERRADPLAERRLRTGDRRDQPGVDGVPAALDEELLCRRGERS